MFNEKTIPNITPRNVPTMPINKPIVIKILIRLKLLKPIVFKIQTSGKTSKKAISEAVSAIKKDAAKISAVLKK